MFSDKKLWSKQEEILWSVRRNKYTVVKSGNTIGKSFIAADVALDFLLTYQPSKVITTATGWEQVEGILWKEIRLAHQSAKVPIGGELLATELKFSDEWFAKGISTNDTVRFQGYHSPYLLVIIDEASGVAPEIWEAVRALHPFRVLAIGNPLEISGEFFNAFQSTLWHKITVSCKECVNWQKVNGLIPGLVTQEWITESAEEWGVNSPQYKIHVLGEFPEETDDTLISRAWVDRAKKGLDADGIKLDEELEEDSTRILSMDVATKHGANESVMGYRYGHTFKELKGYKQIPTTKSADILSSQFHIRNANFVVVDADGVGEGTSDILIDRSLPVIEFHGGYGQKAIDKTKFRNLRSQFYWIVAKKFEKGAYNLSALPEQIFEILKNQLCSIRVKPPDAMGRIQIETKDDMSARGIKSPDYADCFMMAEYGYWASKYADIKPWKYR